MKEGRDQEQLLKNVNQPEIFEIEDSAHSLSIDAFTKAKESFAATDNIKGIIIMIISCVIFGAMGFQVKLAYNHNNLISSVDLIFIRSLIMIPLYYLYARYMKVNLISISTQSSIILFSRWVSGSIGLNLLFYSVKLLPASIAFMIFNTNPLITTIFAFLILKENQSLTSLIWLAGAFAGIIWVGVGRRNEKTDSAYQLEGIIMWWISAILCAFSCIWIMWRDELEFYTPRECLQLSLPIKWSKENLSWEPILFLYQERPPIADKEDDGV